MKCIAFFLCDDPKVLDSQVLTNSVEPEQSVLEQSDQDLHCLQFHLLFRCINYSMSSTVYGKNTWIKL